MRNDASEWKLKPESGISNVTHVVESIAYRNKKGVSTREEWPENTKRENDLLH